MSRRNFMHQADSFLNADGVLPTTNTVFTPVRTPMPVGNPEPLPTTTPTNVVKTPINETFGRPTYNGVSSTAPFKPVNVSPEPYTPPILPSSPVEPTRPIVQPEMPKPIAPTVITQIVNPTIPVPEIINPNPTATGSVGSGGISMGGSSSGGGSEKTILKKSWIPLLLTIGGIAVLVIKPFK